MAGKTGPENHISRTFEPGKFTVGIAIQTYEIGIGRFYIDVTVFMPGHFFHRRIEIAGDRVHFFSGQVINIQLGIVLVGNLIFPDVFSQFTEGRRAAADQQFFAIGRESTGYGIKPVLPKGIQLLGGDIHQINILFVIGIFRISRA